MNKIDYRQLLSERVSILKCKEFRDLLYVWYLFYYWG